MACLDKQKNKFLLYFTFFTLTTCFLTYLQAPIPSSLSFLAGQRHLALNSPAPFFPYFLLVYPFTPYVFLWTVPYLYPYWALLITLYFIKIDQVLTKSCNQPKSLYLLFFLIMGYPLLLFYPIAALTFVFSLTTHSYLVKYFEKSDPIHLFKASIFLFLIITTEKLSIALLPFIALLTYQTADKKIPKGPLICVLLFPSLFFILVQSTTSLLTHKILAQHLLRPFIYLPLLDPSTQWNSLLGILSLPISTSLALLSLLTPCLYQLIKYSKNKTLITTSFLLSITYVFSYTARFDVEILFITIFFLGLVPILTQLNKGKSQIAVLCLGGLIYASHQNSLNTCSINHFIKYGEQAYQQQQRLDKILKYVSEKDKMMIDDRKHSYLICNLKASCLSPSHPYYEALLLTQPTEYKIFTQRNSEKDHMNHIVKKAFSNRLLEVAFEEGPFQIWQVSKK